MERIAVEGLGRRIGRAWVLRDVSFEVRRGEIFGVFGRSGSGKSTLLRLIAGLDRPSSGAVVLATSETGERSWLSPKISIALQKPGLAPELTITENLVLFASLWGVPRKGRTARIAMFTELLGLADVRRRQVREVPDGLRAAAEVARGLVARADVTVVDSLLERLDRPTRRRVWEYMLARERQGATFIIGTASADEAAMCNRLAVLSKGRLGFVGAPDEMKAAVQHEVVVVESLRSPLLKSRLKERFGASVVERNGSLEFKSGNAEAEIARILAESGSDVGCVYLREPTLDDALDQIEVE